MKTEITALGYYLSPTALSLVGVTSKGEKAFSCAEIHGETKWRDQPAIDLVQLPHLFFQALYDFGENGFSFATNGVISGFSYPNGLVLLDASGLPLTPALSLGCGVATEEAEFLNSMADEEMVGKFSGNMLLPMLLWTLKQDRELRKQLATATTAVGYITHQFTGTLTLGLSEARDGGLLDLMTERYATDLLCAIQGMVTEWFPPLVKSGQAIFSDPDKHTFDSAWEVVRELLPGLKVIAELGDNRQETLEGPYGCLVKAINELSLSVPAA